MTDEKLLNIMGTLITNTNYWDGNFPKNMLLYNFDNILKSMGKLKEFHDNPTSSEGNKYLCRCSEIEAFKLFQESDENLNQIYKILGLSSYRPMNELEKLLITGEDKKENAPIRNFLYKIVPLTHIATALTMNSQLNLREGEVEVYTNEATLYESRVQGHNYDYNGANFGYGGFRFGHADVKRESYSDMVPTVDGFIDITNKRIIISGTDLSTDVDKTKVINMSSIFQYTRRDKDLLSLETNGNSVMIKFDSEIEMDTVIDCLNQIKNGFRNIELPDRVSLNFNSFDELEFGYDQSDDFEDIEDFRNWIIELFDHHIELEKGKYSISSYQDTYVTVGKEGSEYFRNLIIKDGSNWNKKINLLEKNIQLLDKWISYIYIIDKNYEDNYYGLLTLQRYEYPDRIDDNSERFNSYREENDFFVRPNENLEKSSNLSDKAVSFLNKIYVLFYTDEDSKKSYYIVNFRNEKYMDDLPQDDDGIRKGFREYLDSSMEIVKEINKNKKDNEKYPLIFIGIPFSDPIAEKDALDGLVIQEGSEALLEKNYFVLNADGTINRLAKEYQTIIDGDIEKKEIENSKDIKEDNDTNKFDEIKKYKELLDMNIITEKEFELKKKKLLNL
ncbi:SHOCT domain-containing protein [Companilactobacillus farciminis]|uniref:SHOCT domain-containing protein n=1 Tax=Companilactobacillus farciminis TaxID=1612 RepID=UPI00232CCD22|nr:SHOCT domain-containing protein [Companilactobacillus farciminis]WCG36683.1 hypothetical protein PML84_05805 [Companilactobacillus farciminis]